MKATKHAKRLTILPRFTNTCDVLHSPEVHREKEDNDDKVNDETTAEPAT